MKNLVGPNEQCHIWDTKHFIVTSSYNEQPDTMPSVNIYIYTYIYIYIYIYVYIIYIIYI